MQLLAQCNLVSKSTETPVTLVADCGVAAGITWEWELPFAGVSISGHRDTINGSETQQDSLDEYSNLFWGVFADNVRIISKQY